MATRMQQRRGTASQWTSANPVLNAGEMGWESDTNKFKIGDGTNHWADLDYFADINSTVNPSFGTSIIFEGATADSYETTLQVTDPTADRTITLPNADGTVVLTTTLDEMAQDAVNTALTAGTGITKSYDDNANTITLSVDTSTIQARVADVSDTEIGYLNGVTSAIQTQLDAKFATANASTTNISEGTNLYFTDERAQDAVGNSLGSGLSYNDSTGAVSVDTATIQARVADVSDTEIGYLNGVTSAIQTQLDNKLALSGGTMTGSIAMGTSKITGLGTPTADTDAATKSYVDAATAGLNVHASVQAATTANITLASAVENGDTLDGVTLATGNRILVKNQTDKTENGIYVVAASGAPSRADDYNSAGEVDAGDFIYVEAGTANGKTGWIQTNVITTIGSDNIEFTQFSGAGTYSAGNGLTLTGSTFAIDTSITQTRVSGVSDTEIGYLDGVTSAIQTQLNAKAPSADPTFTGTLVLPSTVNGPSISTSVNLLFPTQSGHITLGGSQTTGNLTLGGGSNRTTGVIGIGTGATSSGTKTINVGTGSTGGTTAITIGSADGATSNITLNGSVTGTSNLTLNSTSELRLADTDSTHYVGFKAPGTVSSNKIWTLPSADGTSGQMLSTNGSGTLSWSTAGGGAAFSELMLIGA